jgi:hypothetical protein
MANPAQWNRIGRSRTVVQPERGTPWLEAEKAVALPPP